jgi:hypothetical protein
MDRKIVQQLMLGSGLNRIVRELCVSKHRVLRVRAQADECGYLDGSRELPPYPEALFPEVVDGRTERTSAVWRELGNYLPWIRERLEAGWHAVTVFEELPCRVPRSNFYRFLQRHRLNDIGKSLRRVVPEIVHEPGEALLVDWGYLWTIEEDGKKRKLWVFLGVLGYSRYLVARAMTSCDLEETLWQLSSMYEELGGVPSRTTSDNPKVFALKADRYEPVLNPAFERFAAHYGTLIECLPPRDPEKKGKVERPMPYIRRLLEPYPGDRNDAAAIQAYLTAKLVIANARKHGTTHERPCERFRNEEQPALKPLPVLPFEREEYHEGTVRLDGHVRFQGKYYSVDERYIRKSVTVIGNSRQVLIYQAGTLIETHERLVDRSRSKATKRHHLKPWERVCDNPEGLKGLAAKIGEYALIVVEEILRKGDGFIDFRRIWGILSLDKKYSSEEINAACKHALFNEDFSYRAILRLIEETREERSPDAVPAPLPRGKFQRDLSEYTQLLFHFNNNKGDIYEH